MRIALITSWPMDERIGSGVVRMFRGLNEGFKSNGHQSIIVHPDYDESDPLKLANRRLEYNRRLRDKKFSDYDLIIASDFDGFALSGDALNRFVVISAGLMTELVEFEEGRQKKIIRHLSCREKQNMMQAQKILTPSKYCAEAVTRLYGIPKEKIYQVPLGINFNEWDHYLSNFKVVAKKGINILCVARQYRRKGINDLLLAFSMVLRTVPDASLAIVGGGPDEERNKQYVQELGLSDAVKFYGDVLNRAVMASFYKKADIFCLPSYHETFGLVFLEAMAAGLPVVAYSSTAVPELITSDEGILCEKGNINTLAYRLIDLCKNVTKREQLGSGGIKKAQFYKWETTSAKIAELCA
ncbi:MAG: glycosyltransferase family 4 protein [Calditrichaceae bacterium]